MLPEFTTFADLFAVHSNVVKPLVYIASAYTLGDKLQNVLDQFVAADLILELGLIPYPPLWTHYWDSLSPKTYEFWMAYDREIIRRCDCLFRLPGVSAGADDEIVFAISIGIPVFYSLDELGAYYES